MGTPKPAAQGSIWFANLSPVEGNEQAGTRPVLIVSRDEMNRTGMSMIVPGTTVYKNRPARVALPEGHGGLPEATYLLCDQLRTVDHARLIRRVGDIAPKYLSQVLSLLHYFLSLPRAL